MLHFIFKRTIYSTLIILGVMLLTFVLFKVSAGDVAAAVLGKNSKAEEIEALRLKLGTDKPLFYGRWQRTEAFGQFFDKKLPIKKDGVLILKPSFYLVDSDLKLMVTGHGDYSLQGIEAKDYQINKVDNGVNFIISKDITGNLDELRIAYKNGCVAGIKFFRQNKSPYDSQFFDSIKEIVTITKEFPYLTFFNFGETLTTREPIKKIIKSGIMPSMCLMLPIFAGEIFFGILFALLATAFKGKFLDKGILLFSVASMSISYIVLIIAGQWYLAFYCNFFPVWGFYSLIYLILPIIIGIVSGLGANIRFYRTVFVNELNAEYLRTARAKGCNKLTIYTQHLLRNAAIPILTRASASLPFLFTGSLLLESYFGIPGLGYIGLRALNDSDLNLLKAIVMLSAFLYVVINLITDIAYAWVDPRVRLK